jgi:hypothetical protein
VYSDSSSTFRRNILPPSSGSKKKQAAKRREQVERADRDKPDSDLFALSVFLLSFLPSEDGGNLFLQNIDELLPTSNPTENNETMSLQSLSKCKIVSVLE